MLKVTLDSSVFSPLPEDLPLLDDLVRLSNEGKIEMFIAPHMSFQEISRMGGRKLKQIIGLIESVDQYTEIDESTRKEDGTIVISPYTPLLNKISLKSKEYTHQKTQELD